jgi:hypothetical protein
MRRPNIGDHGAKLSGLEKRLAVGENFGEGQILNDFWWTKAKCRRAG